MKIPEGPWTTDSYNACGYRTSSPCGPKPTGTLRIVFVGSSITHGVFVPYDDTFAELLRTYLAQDLHRPVQMENLGVFGMDLLEDYRRLPEVLSLQPDLVFLTISPTDLMRTLDPKRLAERDNPAAHYQQPPVVPLPFLQQFKVNLQAIATIANMAIYWRYRDTRLAVRNFVSAGDVGYLREPTPPAWQSRFADLQTLIDGMAGRLHSRDIPLVLISVPGRLQVAMCNPRYSLPGFYPDAFGTELGAVANKAAIPYVDSLLLLDNMPAPETLFYTVNSHPNAQFSELLARHLVPLSSKLLERSPALPEEKIRS